MSRHPSLPRRKVLLTLSRDADVARRLLDAAAGPGEISELHASQLRRWPIPRCDDFGVAGSPPEDEIGYGFAVLAVAAARPERVALVDTGQGDVRWSGRARFLTSALAPAVAQLGASALSVGAQRLLAAAPLRANGRARGEALRRALYVRPLVGSASPAGGSVTHAHEVIRALRGCGVAVEGVTTDPWIADAASDMDPSWSWRLVRVPRSFKAIPASAALGGDLALVTAALGAARRADVVYQRHSRFSLAGALLARLAGRPLFLEYNGPESFFRERWQPTPLAGRLAACEEAALRAATRIVVVSSVDRDSLLGRGIEDGRIVLNPNGVDPDRFARGGGPEIRRNLGLPPENVVVGFVGSFGPWHGAPVLARAFVRVAGTVPAARLLLVGAGPELDEVRRTITEAGLDDRAVYTGLVNPGDVPRYLDACDVLASPHVQLPGGERFFGSPTKLYEYMAAGKAIAASRLEQIGEVLDHERSALLVEPGDIEGLAGALVRLAGDADLRARLGSEARRDAEARHTWRANAERLVGAYEELGAL
jgi:glycosyltransferase involved in cell wall biosynthesis